MCILYLMKKDYFILFFFIHIYYVPSYIVQSNVYFI